MKKIKIKTGKPFNIICGGLIYEMIINNPQDVKIGGYTWKKHRNWLRRLINRFKKIFR